MNTSRLLSTLPVLFSLMIPAVSIAEAPTSAYTGRVTNTQLLFDSPPASETSPPGNRPVPELLSQYPELLQAALGNPEAVVQAGGYPYQPNAQLWSDGAHKERFLALPGTSTMGYTSADAFQFPIGSVTIKNFLLPLDQRTPNASLLRVETRLFVLFPTGWQGYSYKWNEEQTDAALLPTTGDLLPYTVTLESGTTEERFWAYPSRGQCFACHTEPAGIVLGVTAAQLNWDYTHPHNGAVQNQLEAYESIGLFGDTLPDAPLAELPFQPDYRDTTRSLETRWHSYAAINCAPCHRPGGGTGVGNMDLRWEVSPEDWNVIDVNLNRVRLPLRKRIVSGDPESSAFVGFMEDAFMPFLGVSVPDEENINLLREYINNLEAEQPARDYWVVQ
jgi:uncharacterized repeat protein (TIGR03806 family)